MVTSIIQAEHQHIDMLIPLFERYRAFYRMAPSTDRARAFLQQRLEARESVLLMALDKAGHAVGFLQLFPSFSSVRLCRHWILNDLFVADGARRMGVGRSLINAAIDLARESGVSSLELATEKTNGPARSLYESQGWRLEDEYDRYVYLVSP